MENCLPAAFQYWAIPEIRKSLDKKISLLVYGGNQVVVRLIGHISVCEHFSEDFSKEKLVDSSFEKLYAMTKDKQNIFLIQEF